MVATDATIFTTLPNGRSATGTYRVSVHVAPHLRGSAGLFGRWTDWPAKLPTFGVMVNDAGPFPATVTAAPSTAHWRALFDGSVVEASDPAALRLFDAVAVKSYPALHLAKGMKAMQAVIAQNSAAAATGPTLELLRDQLRPILFNGPVGASIQQATRQKLATALATKKAIAFGDLAALRPTTVPLATFQQQASFVQHADFYHRGAEPDIVEEGDETPGTQVLAPIAAPKFDFHQKVSVLATHPELLRTLGLVLDLEFEVPAENIPSTPTRTIVRVVQIAEHSGGGGSGGPIGGGPDGSPGGGPIVIPPPGDGGVVPPVVAPATDPGWTFAWTRCLFGPDAFVALPRDPAGGPISRGHYRLNSDAFDVIDIDPDRAAFATRMAADKIPADAAADTPVQVPSISSDGLSVIHNDRAVHLADAQSTFRKRLNGLFGLDGATADDAYLDADDLVIGFRLDVYDEDDPEPRWCSLTRRAGEYVFTRTGDTVVLDAGEEHEGIVTTTSTTTHDPDEDDAILLTEVMARWHGWSLSVARPGKLIATDTSANPPTVDGGQTPAAHDQGLDIRLDRAIGLPALRFGHSYRFRARLVDLAGNGLRLREGAEPDNATLVSPPIRFDRYEPLLAPLLSLSEPILPAIPLVRGVPSGPSAPGGGEAVDQLVIRSEDEHDSTSDTTFRHASPPPTSQLLAEYHGVLDEHGRPLRSKYATVAGRDNDDDGSYAVSGHSLSQPNLGGVEDPSTPDGIRYFPFEDLDVPYLPDVFARNAVLRGLPGPDTFVYVPFGNNRTWPEYPSFRIRLTKPSYLNPPIGGPVSMPSSTVEVPATATSNRVVEVRLQPGEVAKAGLSSHFDPTQLPELAQMALFQDIAASGLPIEQKSSLTRLILEGQHQSFTPRRFITFVHATRRPVKDPVFKSGTVIARTLSTAPGEEGQHIVDRNRTFVPMFGQIDYSRSSSSRVDIKARWIERVDDGTTDPMAPRTFEDLALSLTLDRSAVPDGEDTIKLRPDRHRHELRDTKHHEIDYSAEATSAFVHHFVQRLAIRTPSHRDDRFSTPQAIPTGGKPLVQGTVTVRVVGTSSRALLEGTEYIVDHEQATIAFQVEAGQDVEISFVVGPVTRAGRSYRQTIRSSANPPVPVVDYVVPSFKWTLEELRRSPGGPLTDVVSTRGGGGLRVYLARPWLLSGEGERLGVAVAGNRSTDQELVTRVGFDPIFRTDLNPTQTLRATAQRFPLATEIATELITPNQSNTVDIAGHAVEFDPRRDRWYSDIQIQPGSEYFPFVRLALVRYQPTSMEFCEISDVVVPDMIQLAPERETRVSFLDRRVISVSTVGESYAPINHLNSNSPIARPASVTVLLQRKLRNATDPVLGWQDVGLSRALTYTKMPNGQDRWHLPKLTVPIGGGPYRVVLEEFQYLAGDGDKSVTDQGFVGGSDTMSIIEQGDTRSVKRLVFTDIIDLPGY